MITVAELEEMPFSERVEKLSEMSKEELRDLVLMKAKELERERLESKLPELTTLAYVEEAVAEIGFFELPEDLKRTAEKLNKLEEVRKLLNEIYEEYRTWWKELRWKTGMIDIHLKGLKKLPSLKLP